MKRYEPHIRKTVKARDDWLIVFQVFGHSRRKKGSQGYTDLPSHPHTHAPMHTQLRTHANPTLAYTEARAGAGNNFFKKKVKCRWMRFHV